MAKIVVFNEYGGPEVLHLVDVPDPEAGAGQVRIRVKAAGVQPFDCATRRGDFAAYNPLTFPVRLGNEVAGIVDQVGDGVTGFADGDEVIAYLDMQGYADTVVVPAEQVGHKPAKMPWAEAGVLTASGQTAYTALDELRVGAQDTLLVHAAAGGVGSFAVQLAKARGAQVVGTASERNHDYLRSLGAVPVTYGPGLADRVRAAVPQGITCALDAIGGEALDVSLELLGSTERIVTIADWARSAQLGIRRIGTERSAQKLDDLTRLWSEGKLVVEVAETVPLSRAAEAHRLVETGHVRGKVALVVD
ncbi:enoyl reductase [Micromonospora sediminicola]|uniref:Enoyl reductase n=1 Tax=Micromonospora sediminicola TaxID=946078 RepID=A0A1A9BAX2_9ACTN|nr:MULTISPECIES: NADP-dependent oxidoreductase [Micromonospora]PGH44376.1 NADP-dependent oxidoreductase [Micromonospora sp. WMMA1996]SBT66129.1 enoyl reductase [Micromonospora sediminicola]